LNRDELPFSSTTLDFDKPSDFARKSRNALLASPSTGAAAIRTRRIILACGSSSQPMISLCRALGVARTRSFIGSQKSRARLLPAGPVRLNVSFRNYFAAAATSSLVMPSSFITTSPGALMPKRSIPSALPSVPTYFH